MSALSFFGGFKVTAKQVAGGRVTFEYPREKRPKPPRAHGRHVLNRYEDGMEKCIGCELCAGVCPADCIYVRGRENPEGDPVSPGERYGYVYEINYLRCIHCDLCVEACPTEAITESKLFEFSFTNRFDAIYEHDQLLVAGDGRAKRQPWEDWREGEDQNTSAWMRATAPGGRADYEGRVQWSPELGFGTRPPERGQRRGVGESSSAEATVAGPEEAGPEEAGPDYAPVFSLRKALVKHLPFDERPPEERGVNGAMRRLRERTEWTRETLRLRRASKREGAAPGTGEDRSGAAR